MSLQINSLLKTSDKSVSAELTILANVTDNQAQYRCEAHNSATEIPLFESKTLSVHCKFLLRRKFLCALVTRGGQSLDEIRLSWLLLSLLFSCTGYRENTCRTRRTEARHRGNTHLWLKLKQSAGQIELVERRHSRRWRQWSIEGWTVGWHCVFAWIENQCDTRNEWHCLHVPK